MLAGGWRIEGGVLDPTPLLAAIAQPGSSPCKGANLFHGTLIAGLAEWIGMAARAEHIETVALGGGCLLNRVLAEGLCTALRAQRSAAFTAARTSTRTTGRSAWGQVWVARRQS